PWPGYFWLSLTQMVTIKYSPDGIEEWIALHTTYTNTGSAICLASDNSIYAVGQMYAVTIHYTQTEPVICTTPTGLFTNAISTAKARLNWSLVPDAYQYEIWFKKSTATPWKKKFVSGISNKLNIKGLLCNANYVWQIRTICDTTGTDLVSDFSSIQNFTTAPCRLGETAEGIDILLNVYPVPAADHLTIKFSLPANPTFAIIEIYGSNGKIVYTVNANIDGGQITEVINTSYYPSGIYLLKITSDDTFETQQIVISK
ncbi:MAG: T9SS type A sorting domain-containing protein, partial [Fimbriimonadaceae bacterium]|nr:T9SS type A sorting domain-containing protein [Chitinophagales bacterium]